MKIMTYLGPRQLVVSEVGDLALGADQVRIETLYTGISHGTEMNVYRGVAPFFRRKQDRSVRLFRQAEADETWTYPVRSCDPGVWYMGYANVGRVVELGKDVTTLGVGDLVYTHAPHQSQIVSQEHQVTKLPDTLKPEHGIFFTNLMTAFNGILDANIKLGDTVVVSGLGVLGQFVVQMAKLSGARQVFGVEVFDQRAQVALANGADRVFNPAGGQDIAFEIRKLTKDKGADVTIEASGNDRGLHEAIRIAAPDTTVIALGWYQGATANLNLSEEFHHNRVIIRSSQTGSVNPALAHMWNVERKKQTVMWLLQTLTLDNLITHRIPYPNAADAYQLIDREPDQVIQVILTYGTI